MAVSQNKKIMIAHAKKTQDKKIQSASNAVSQMQPVGESTFQFVDNRPEAIAQMKLQELANNSPQVSQLRAIQDMANSSSQATQLKSIGDIANKSAYNIQTMQLVAMANGAGSPGVVQRVKDKDEGRKKYRGNIDHQADEFIAARRLKPVDKDGRNASAGRVVHNIIKEKGANIQGGLKPVDKDGRVASRGKVPMINIKEEIAEKGANIQGGLKKTGFNGRVESIKEMEKRMTPEEKQVYDANRSIRNEGHEIEKKYSPFIGPMPPTPKKAKDNTDLGDDLNMIQGDMEKNYAFDQPADSMGKWKAKAHGMKHALKKHPKESIAKAIVGMTPAAIPVNLGGAIFNHFKKGEARKLEHNPNNSEAQNLMWHAHKQKQSNKRNKKGKNAAIGITAAAVSGGVDMGLSSALGSAASAGGEVAKGIASAFGGMGSEAIANMAGQTTAIAAAQNIGVAAAQELVVAGADKITEKFGAAVGNKVNNRSKPKTKRTEGKDARITIRNKNSTNEQKALLHKSLLGQDLKYGKALNETVRGTLDETLPAGAAPDFSTLSGVDPTPWISKSKSKDPIEDPKEAFERTKTAKSHMLSHFKESVEGKNDPTNLVPTEFQEKQIKTKGAAMHRFRKGLGYAKDGKLMTKDEAVKHDSEINNFSRTRWFDLY